GEVDLPAQVPSMPPACFPKPLLLSKVAPRPRTKKAQLPLRVLHIQDFPLFAQVFRRKRLIRSIRSPRSGPGGSLVENRRRRHWRDFAKTRLVRVPHTRRQSEERRVGKESRPRS